MLESFKNIGKQKEQMFYDCTTKSWPFLSVYIFLNFFFCAYLQVYFLKMG